MNYIDIRELPKCVRDVLKKVGWIKQEISFELVEHISLRQSTALRYNRGFAVIVNIKTGKHRIGIGSYGGSNQMFKTIIDDCDYRFTFPAHYVIIKGEHGAGGSYATLYMRPDSALPVVGSEDDQEDRQYKILKIYQNTAYGNTRNILLSGSKPADLRDLLRSAMIVYCKEPKTKEEGFKITKRGRKFVKKYETMFPHKVYFQ